MQYLYHGVPEPMIDKTLLPLNHMRTTLPQLYKKYLEKYEGREEILQKKIPLLDCLWNDVVQLLPLNPQSVFNAQRELGIIKTIPPYKFFQINLAIFDPSKTAVYFKTTPGEETVSVRWLKDVDLTTIQEIPKVTLDYYKTFVGSDDLPFNYQFIPHILYLGEIDISNAPVVQLK
jgi:hypothetical protein